MRNNKVFEQKHIPLLGAINQLLGATIGLASIFTFLFSGIAAWNTPTIGYLRDIFPWLSIWSFIGIIIVGILFIMWIQHKYVQQSTVDYWRRMFYDKNPSIKRQKAIEEIILRYVIRDDKERQEAKEILDHAED